MGSSSSLLDDESIDAISDEIKALDNAVRRAPEEKYHDLRDYRKQMYVRNRFFLTKEYIRTDTHTINSLNSLIRPKRSHYEMSDLGEKRFRIRGKTYVRQDLTLRNGRRKNLQCSHWKLENDKGVKQPCVLFLHGNSGSRVDALPYVQGILSRGMRYAVSVFERSFQSYH